ncbi:MAG: hypothetical protein H7067_07675 [Burkholderiales bacterium]|nr:hypothetical protein [Opitutaceae bacterium]
MNAFKTTSTPAKTRSRACAIWAILLLSSLLTGCQHASPAAVDSRRLYQPSVLRLAPGQATQTADGLHIPQVFEIWHSDARFRALENSYHDALAANLALSAQLTRARAQ